MASSADAAADVSKRLEDQAGSSKPLQGATDSASIDGALDKEMGLATRESSTEELPSEVAAPAVTKKVDEDCGCGPDTTELMTDVTVNNSIPSISQIEKAYGLPVLDANGKEHTFKSIVEKEGLERHFIIFIRHFFCSLCQDYLEELAKILPPSTLPAKSQITIISNGHPSYINTYKSRTQTPYALYVDPSPSNLYAALELGHTQDMGTKPKYVKKSLFQTIITGITQGVSAGRNSVRGGNFLQVGGEFLFVRETNWKCTWAHRMKTTRDHTEVDDLKSLLLGKTGSVDAPMVAADTPIPRPNKGRLDSVKSNERLSRRLSGRFSSLIKREGSTQNNKSEKVNGKAPIKSDVANGKSPVLNQISPAIETEETAHAPPALPESGANALSNGGTIRPVAGSPVL